MHIGSNIPTDFQKIINELIGTESESFFKSIQTTSPASIRINPNKNTQHRGVRDIPWTKWGKYLDERPIYTLDPLLHAGAYYVQEPSSMFLEEVILRSVDTSNPVVALDVCAAPGGKSTHLASLLHPESLLVSNEVIRTRASILSENVQKWGSPSVLVTNNDPSHFSKLEGIFDLIVVDAPCSGEGLFRKDPMAIKEWSLGHVDLCSLRQQRILRDVWPTLKQGGVLVYCTCTFNAKEDEDNMAWLSQTGGVEFLSIPLQKDWGIIETKSEHALGYKFFPHKVDGEGFFISAVRKIESQDSARIHSKVRLSLAAKGEHEVANWLKNPASFNLIKNGEMIFAIPAHHHELIEFLSHQLRVILPGIPLATPKHGKFIPEHGAALSIQLDRSKFTTIDVGYDQAIQYLRKDPITLNEQAKGFALVAYKKNPLGWVNVLANRINNLYPANWRIRIQPKNQ